MPLNEMPPQPVADPEGPLEVHAIVVVAMAEVGPHQGLGTRLDLEAVAVDGDDRQAAAVDRDALPDPEGIVRREAIRVDGEAEPLALGDDPHDPSQHLYQSREHRGFSRSFSNRLPIVDRLW